MMEMFLSDSEWESSSESGSSEDQEETEFFYGGQASCILSSLEETIGKIDEFLSFERGFLHGEVVCSVADPSGQMGKVVGIDMLVDLENGHGTVLKDVDSKKLLKIRSINTGDLIVSGPWIGRVDKVIDRVTVVFDDGARCEIIVLDREKLLPISPNILEDSQYPYYPGQRVRVTLSTVSKSARWLCGTWKDNQDEGTIFSVEAGLVYIDWLASILIGCNSSVPPQRLQNAKNLTLLSCFSHANWQLGDWCMLPVSENKVVMVENILNASSHNFMNEHKKLERGFKGRNLGSNSGEIFSIVKTKTKVVVLWQDGSLSMGLDSQILLPTNTVNAHEFWPEQLVLEKGTCDEPQLSSNQRWGVVRSVDAKERTVKVQWRTLTPNEVSKLDECHIEETMSAYELVEHPDYSFSIGDLVFRSTQNKFGGLQAVKDNVNSEIAVDEEAALKGKKSDMDQREYLDCIGIVTGFTDGAVDVKWANCSATKVAPNEIIRIDKHEGSATTIVAHEENVDQLSQQLIEHEKIPNSQEGKDSLNGDGDGAGRYCKKLLWESRNYFLPRAAIGFFSSVVASLFGSLGTISLSGIVSSCQISEEGNEPIILHEKEVEICGHVTEPNESAEVHTSNKTSSNSKDENISVNKDLAISTSSDDFDQVRQFDMVPNCPDHHFIGSGKGSALSQMRRDWLKKVQQEWSILEKNLPETIYIRVFEERMDLIRAVIVGAPGTPYHDGLFFFDILLPPEYPHEPPLVHYISGGLRVNPNLYESGKVCLSLLNTWTGSGTEVWNPGNSTILQVLLSLQALVLNEKPYFNEAGYDAQVGRAEGERNSVSYNENAFLVTCNSMLYLIRQPPKHFEALVEEHFCRRSQHILQACKAYMEGAPVGYPCGYGTKELENQNGSSTGFKIMLTKLLQKLVEVFSEEASKRPSIRTVASAASTESLPESLFIITAMTSPISFFNRESSGELLHHNSHDLTYIIPNNDTQTCA